LQGAAWGDNEEGRFDDLRALPPGPDATVGEDERMSEPQIPEIDIDEARARVEAGAALLDVREADEWQAGRAEQARWIPMGEVGARHDELPDDRQLVVICRSGGRSGKVVAALAQAGYDAVNVAGGMKAWEASGFTVVADDGTPGVVT
jgi:rhodanese-related sulfurtransferase